MPGRVRVKILFKNKAIIKTHCPARDGLYNIFGVEGGVIAKSAASSPFSCRPEMAVFPGLTPGPH